MVCNASAQTFEMEQVPFSPNVNSPFDEENPVFSVDGQTLYFTRSNHPENVGGISDKGDIWYSELGTDGQWSEARNLGRPLNDRFINGVIGFAPNGDKMYLRNFYINDHNNLVAEGISVAKKTATGWRYPQNVKINYFTNESEHQSMCLSRDGKVLIMSIESYGTHGAEDLYVSFEQPDGSWSEPRNLGYQVNTEFQEMTPFLASDNKTLYFSSNGYGGFGSKDIYVTTRLDDTWKNWGKPKNLGLGINTMGAETSFLVIPGTREAVVISTKNSDGYGDIKKLVPVKLSDSVQLSEEPSAEISDGKIVDVKELVSFKVKVVDEETSAAVTATVELFSDTEGQNDQKRLTNADGTTSIQVSPGYYILEVSAKNYLVEKIGLEINGDNVKEVKLKPARVGTTVQLKNVLFKTSTSKLLPSSYPELEKVYKLMKNSPDLVIELSGHTDNRGDYYLNLKLSEDRVNAVKEYLKSLGISEDRMKGKGYGGTRPIASNETEETRRLNRRVEFTIISD
jgi:outer membrane protein OmpA-like peptidoglycan-associated protein